MSDYHSYININYIATASEGSNVRGDVNTTVLGGLDAPSHPSHNRKKKVD